LLSSKINHEFGLIIERILDNPNEASKRVHETFIRRALKLAEKGRGNVSPNPLVGAVVVKDGQVVGEGFHKRFGEAHAEVNALEAAGDQAIGATLYTNLEPCAHQGKTPPCVEKIWEAGIQKVVVGIKDSNPLVNGKGLEFLAKKGISVQEGVLEDECRQINAGYLKHVVTGIPLITLKIAQTLDGRIASSTGHSRWITSEKSLVEAHKLRAQYDAVLIGVGTVITDDPHLTVRHVRGSNPWRIILDSHLRVPLDSNLISEDDCSKTLIISAESASMEKLNRIEERGAKVLVLPSDVDGWVSQDILWNKIGELGITSVLVEGGSVVLTSILKSRFADNMVIFIAPKIIGNGVDAVGDLEIRNINDAIKLDNIKVKKIDSDLMLIGSFKKEEIKGN